MEQQDKYYTPSIEDIRVGYEYEINALQGIKADGSEERIWTKSIIRKEDVPVHLYDFTLRFLKPEELKHIRIPYLTKEQIEAEGWIELQIYPNNSKIFRKGTENNGYELLYKGESVNDWSTKIYITKVWSVMESNYRRNLIEGANCPSINEFRYITNKLLNIK